MPALRLPIFDQSLFKRPVEEQVKTLADFIMRYRRELEYLLNGQLDDDNGVFRAATIISNAIVTNVLTAQKGYIAQLTVDELDTSDKVQNRLSSSTADDNYIRALNQLIQWITASVTDPLEEVQVTNRDSAPLYWIDETHTGVTTDVTAYPVMVYTYDEMVKAEFTFRTINGEYCPVILLGAGTGTGDNGKAIIYKGGNNVFHLGYYHSTSGSLIEITIDNDGVHVPGHEREIIVTSTFPTTPYEGQKIIYTGGDAPKISYSNLKDLPSTFTPSTHGTTHAGGGADAIPAAVASGASGLMTGADKAKLDGVAAGANNYTHPSTHPASIISQDSSNRFVSDTEKGQWNAAEVNQNAFSNVAVSGQTTAAATGKTDTLTLAAGSGISLTTSGKTVTVAATGSGGSAIDVAKAGTLIGTRGKINFVEGSNVTLSVVDDSANDRVNVTVAASGSGGTTAVDSDWGSL